MRVQQTPHPHSQDANRKRYDLYIEADDGFFPNDSDYVRASGIRLHGQWDYVVLHWPNGTRSDYKRPEMPYDKMRLPLMVYADPRMNDAAKDRMVTLLNAAATDYGHRHNTEPLLEEGWLLYANTKASEFEDCGGVWSIVINETGDEPKYKLPLLTARLDDGISMILEPIDGSEPKLVPIRGLVDSTFFCIVRL
jgi:hypothetical protein